jgi:hypothetical protein
MIKTRNWMAKIDDSLRELPLCLVLISLTMSHSTTNHANLLKNIVVKLSQVHKEVHTRSILSLLWVERLQLIKNQTTTR